MITTTLITNVLTNEGWEEKYRSGIVILVGLNLTTKVKNKHLGKKGAFSREILAQLENLNRFLDSDVYDFLVKNMGAIFKWVIAIQISDDLANISGHERRTLRYWIDKSKNP